MIFKGWARMALPLQAFNVVEVCKPNVGQNKPASVKADVLLDTKRTSFLPRLDTFTNPPVRCSAVETCRVMCPNVSPCVFRLISCGHQIYPFL